MIEAKAPDGYVECPNKCGRWYKPTDLYGVANRCNRCFADANFQPEKRAVALANLEASFGPDWTPPASHPDRRTGQRWRYQHKRFGDRVEFTLGERLAKGDGWKDAAFARGLLDAAWTNPDVTMTLIADAPAAKSPEAEAHWFYRANCGAHVGPFVTQALSNQRGKQHEDACAKCKPAPAEAKCQRCWKDGPDVMECGFDGQRPVWCAMCHLQAMEWGRRQAGASVLLDLPTRLPAPRMVHSALWPDWDC